jgi:PAS domain S-box-containing protein
MVAHLKEESRATSQLADGSDARLRALTEHALEIITVQSADGTFNYANEAVVRYLGYSVSDLIGRNAAEFLHPDDADAMRERFRGFLAASDGQPDLNRFEYRFRHRDGTWVWLESVAVNALGNPAVGGIIAHSRDISRRRNGMRPSRTARSIWFRARPSICTSTRPGSLAVPLATGSPSRAITNSLRLTRRRKVRIRFSK